MKNQRHKKFFFLLKMAEIRTDYNFRSENPSLIIKKEILASLNTNSGG